MKKITYVTGNWAKIDSARQILDPLGFTIDNIKMETIEIQADDVEDVAKYSASWACQKLNCPVLKNDSGLFIEALNGFPGVYTHYVDDTLGEDGILKAGSGWTEIFIYPGYHFKMIDSLITNFHLPESTLMMLVSALAGKEKIMHAYEEAVQERYRFFSFGDAMLII